MYPRMDSLTIAMPREEFFGFISEREGLRESYGELSMDLVNAAEMPI